MGPGVSDWANYRFPVLLKAEGFVSQRSLYSLGRTKSPQSIINYTSLKDMFDVVTVSSEMY